MGRKNRKKSYMRSYVRGAWVAVEDDLMLSRAFRDLKPTAVILLLHILRIDKTLSWKNGDAYSGEFNLTFSEAEVLGLARPTTMRAVCDLSERGFIEIVVRGGLKSQRKTSSIYRVSERWRTWGGLQPLTELNAFKNCGKYA